MPANAQPFHDMVRLILDRMHEGRIFKIYPPTANTENWLFSIGSVGVNVDDILVKWSPSEQKFTVYRAYNVASRIAVSPEDVLIVALEYAQLSAAVVRPWTPYEGAK